MYFDYVYDLNHYLESFFLSNRSARMTWVFSKIASKYEGFGGIWLFYLDTLSDIDLNPRIELLLCKFDDQYFKCKASNSMIQILKLKCLVCVFVICYDSVEGRFYTFQYTRKKLCD